jgi:hypothetical protein
MDFEKRIVVKSHNIVDFIADWAEPTSYIEGQVPEAPWLIYCDGA